MRTVLIGRENGRDDGTRLPHCTWGQTGPVVHVPSPARAPADLGSCTSPPSASRHTPSRGRSRTQVPVPSPPLEVPARSCREQGPKFSSPRPGDPDLAGNVPWPPGTYRRSTSSATKARPCRTSTVLTTNKYRSHGQQVPFSRATSTVLASNKYRSRGRGAREWRGTRTVPRQETLEDTRGR